MSYVYSESWTEQQIFDLAKELEGKKLGDLDKSGWLKKKKDKGSIGNIIQSDYFGIPANSIKGADFEHHHIELKVTPILKKKRVGYSSKERLLLGMINYMEDYQIPFEESIVNKKAQSMLLIFYVHEEKNRLRNSR
jgi:DNA mismatch repair protein MutH